MSANRTGKYIHELDHVSGGLKDDAFFAISQDNLTRRAFMRDIRGFINGDNESPSADFYYSSLKVDSLIQEINNKISTSNSNINDLLTDLNAIREYIDTRDTLIQTDLNLFKELTTQNLNDMREYIDEEDAELKEGIEWCSTAIGDINTRLAAHNREYLSHIGAYNMFVGRVEEKFDELDNKIGGIEEIINGNSETGAIGILERLTNLENKLAGMIKFGTAVPTVADIEENGIYVQYID